MTEPTRAELMVANFSQVRRIEERALSLFHEDNLKDDWPYLQQNEKDVVAYYILQAGDVIAVAKKMKKTVEDIEAFIEKPMIQRAVAFFQDKHEAIRVHRIEDLENQTLMDVYPDLLENANDETRRKTGQVVMDARNRFPKYPTDGTQTNIQINVDIPDYKKK